MRLCDSLSLIPKVYNESRVYIHNVRVRFFIGFCQSVFFPRWQTFSLTNFRACIATYQYIPAEKTLRVWFLRKTVACNKPDKYLPHCAGRSFEMTGTVLFTGHSTWHRVGRICCRAPAGGRYHEVTNTFTGKKSLNVPNYTLTCSFRQVPLVRVFCDAVFSFLIWKPTQLRKNTVAPGRPALIDTAVGTSIVTGLPYRES